MPISDENVEKLIATVNESLEQVKKVQTENSILHQKIMDLMEENRNLQIDQRAATFNHPDGNNRSKSKVNPQRPSIEAGMEATEWSILKDEWLRYKRQAELTTEEEICLELRNACPKEVNKLLYEFI